jgi:hypothetical protein
MERTKGLRKIHTERRTANPVKITFAGENTCKINTRVYSRSWAGSCPDAYKADTFSEGL